MKTRKKRETTGKEYAIYCLTIDSVKDLLVANRGLLQAAGSWSVDACCAVHRNRCDDNPPYCVDRASSSDWLFGLWPGPPQRFPFSHGEPTGTDTNYQHVEAEHWPAWGNGDLRIGCTSDNTPAAAPGGSGGYCDQGSIYRGTRGEICGGDRNWGATDVEVWYPR